jgi:cytochrome c oxidase assembly factor CtaG
MEIRIVTPELLNLLQSHWEPIPSVAIGLIAMTGAYLWSKKFSFDFKSYVFLTGVLLLWLALMSPLDELGDQYLFSAHMLQHMILEFIGPLLLVVSLSEELVRRWLKVPAIRWAENALSNPVFTVTIATVVMLGWHVPPIYDITLQSEPIHIIEHITYIVSGVMLWWPVFKPIQDGRLKPMSATTYLTVAAFLASILGMVYTISDVSFYSAYAHPYDQYHLLPLLRDEWGLNPVEDQKLGGAIMWVICTLTFFWALMAVMVEWLAEKEIDDVRTAA